MNRNSYKRKYIRGKKKNTSGTGVGVKMVTLLALFALVYFLSAGVTGKWIYNNVAVPVFSYFGFGSSTTEPTESNSISGFDDSPETATPSDDAKKVEKTITISGFTDYMIQLGAYDSENNAQTDASSIKSRGAAGYIVSADKYRLIAASYQSAESAQSVKSSLENNDGIDSFVYEYTVPKLEFKITATQSQITKIESIFNKYIELKNNIGELAISLDKSEVDISKAKTKLEEYNNTVKEYVDDLSLLVEGNNDNKIVNGLNSLYTQLYDDLKKIIDTDYSSNVVISADLKYNNVKMTDKYASFLTDITK